MKNRTKLWAKKRKRCLDGKNNTKIYKMTRTDWTRRTESSTTIEEKLSRTGLSDTVKIVKIFFAEKRYETQRSRSTTRNLFAMATPQRATPPTRLPVTRAPLPVFTSSTRHTTDLVSCFRVGLTTHARPDALRSGSRVRDRRVSPSAKLKTLCNRLIRKF